MFQLLLIIIYLSFISLGLPDDLLGAAWPSIHQEFQFPVFPSAIPLWRCVCGRSLMVLEPEVWMPL